MRIRLFLPTTLVVEVEQSVRFICVSVCVCVTVTFELNGFDLYISHARSR